MHQVSVVMSVHNDAYSVSASVRSVLNQSDVDLEFIVVADGSDNETRTVLRDWANQDSRLILIEQPHRGLTQALRIGCERATSPYIARQDAGGDVSINGRLHKQTLQLDANSRVAMVSCGTRCVTIDRIPLFDILHTRDDVARSATNRHVTGFKGPSSHPSTMFRKRMYNQVGGYRSEFYFAQDVDLWLRLLEIGEYSVVPELLYESVIDPSSVSGLYREEQQMLAVLAIKSAASRASGHSDSEILSTAAEIRPVSETKKNRRRVAAAHYFVGCCLRERDHPDARRYFRQAIAAQPWHARSWLRLLRS
ncbi:MAG: glycosyltransferase [Gammaproteobacteria bacterium]|nr:glycosyltransferase [Gammaproteobacteria bacterium]MDH3465112.1 glycosyltransferase [Gammaproteobacteria bacterium]